MSIMTISCPMMGLLSQDEIAAAKAAKQEKRQAKRIAKLDLNGDGTVDEAEIAQFKEQRKAAKAERKSNRGDEKHAKRLKPDANDDGFVSVEEHAAAAERMFTFLDANGDGVLTEGEEKK